MSAPPGDRFAAAAAALVGCRFRLHGRDPATGLDCVGLVEAALRATGSRAELPTGYRLRTGPDPRIGDLARQHAFARTGGPVRAGELWLLEPGPGQAHLAIVAPGGAGLIEAHAGLRRVVLTPLAPLPLPPALHTRWALSA